ncbi:MAG: type II secretion system F family protein [Defluviitaleaceae bacterium]|nr:type II secretion system F family protein [Defluviitaleaceae bacterium]
MPKYNYTAVNIAGEKIKGEYNMADTTSVANLLRQRNFYPVFIEEQKTKEAVFVQKIKLKFLAPYCGQFAAMIRSGVPIGRSLDILQQQTEYPLLKKLTARILQEVQKGSSLSEAISPYTGSFPVIFTSMVEAGEQSGSLDHCMERAGNAFTRTAKLNGRVKSAMVYPTIVLLVMLALVIVLLTVIVPQFAGIYEQQGAQLPAFTQSIIIAGDFMVAQWYVVIGAIATTVIGFRVLLAFEIPKNAWDKLKMRLPIVGKLITKVYAARFTRTLASLTGAGVPIGKALNITARSISNKYVEKQIYKIIEGVNRGEMLSGQLEMAGIFPPLIIHSTSIGEESGTLDEMLLKTADFYDDEADLALQALMSMLEPALIILLAVLIAPILVGVLLPMFGMLELMLN